MTMLQKVLIILAISLSLRNYSDVKTKLFSALYLIFLDTF